MVLIVVRSTAVPPVLVDFADRKASSPRLLSGMKIGTPLAAMAIVPRRNRSFVDAGTCAGTCCYQEVMLVKWSKKPGVRFFSFFRQHQSECQSFRAIEHSDKPQLADMSSLNGQRGPAHSFGSCSS